MQDTGASFILDERRKRRGKEKNNGDATGIHFFSYFKLQAQ